MCRLLLLLLLVAAVSAQPARTDFALRLLDGDTERQHLLVFAGHGERHLHLRLQWTPVADAPQAVIVLPPAHALAEAEVSGIGYDNTALVTMNRLVVAWRGKSALWRVMTGANVTAPLLNLAPTSSWWLTYPTIVMSGAQLFAGPAPSGSGDSSRVETAGNHTLEVIDAGNRSRIVAPLEALTLRVDLDRAQSLLPASILALWLRGGRRVLLDGQHLLLSESDARDDGAVAPDMSSANETQLVIGRVLFARIARRWQANASGIVHFDTVRGRDEQDPVGYVLLAVIFLSMYVLSYWSSTLAPLVGLRRAPTALLPSKAERRRTLRHLVVLTVAAGVAHGLGFYQVGRGAQFDADVTAALQTYAIVSGVLSALNFALLYMEAVRLFVLGGSGGDGQLFTAQLVCAAHTLAVSLLPAAARSLVGLVIFAAVTLVLVLLPTLYVMHAALVRFAATAPNPPPRTAVAALVALATAVGHAVCIALCVIQPLLATVNARYDLAIVAAATGVIVCSTVVAAGYVVLQETTAALSAAS